MPRILWGASKTSLYGPSLGTLGFCSAKWRLSQTACLFFFIWALDRSEERKNNLTDESAELIREKALRKTTEEAYWKAACGIWIDDTNRKTSREAFTVHINFWFLKGWNILKYLAFLGAAGEARGDCFVTAKVSNFRKHVQMKNFSWPWYLLHILCCMSWDEREKTIFSGDLLVVSEHSFDIIVNLPLHGPLLMETWKKRWWCGWTTITGL